MSRSAAVQHPHRRGQAVKPSAMLVAAAFGAAALLAGLLVLLSQVLRNRAYRDLRHTYAALTPCGYAIGEAIRSRLPGLGAEVFTFRIVTAFTLVLDAISDPSLNGVLAPEAARPEAAYEIAMAAALGCLCAEPGNADGSSVGGRLLGCPPSEPACANPLL